MADATAVIMTVVDKAKRPVAGALVAIESGSRPFPEIALVTDAAGHVTFHLPDGQFQVKASADSGATGRASASVAGGKSGSVQIIVTAPKA
jgi:Carboxypeptidase regulatory-like domain